MLLASIKYGHVHVDWDAQGNMTLAREDNGQHIQLSRSEWSLLLKIAELRGWPVCPPGVKGGDDAGKPVAD